MAGLLAVGLTSCKKNLILTPNDQVTSQQVFSTPTGYDQAMAKVYGSLCAYRKHRPCGSGDIQGIDEGTSDFFRLLWYCGRITY